MHGMQMVGDWCNVGLYEADCRHATWRESKLEEQLTKQTGGARMRGTFKVVGLDFFKTVLAGSTHSFNDGISLI